MPFDRRLLELSLLTPQDIQWVDAYHQLVAKEVAPYLGDTDRAWLEQASRPL